jgi:uncharacterized membrane protein
VLGLLLLAIFLLWLLAAQIIYSITLGPEPPSSITVFARDVLTTGAGWAMIIVGMGVGFLFAVVVLSISVVSFPLLLDRDVGLRTAVMASIHAVTENPVPMAVWGMIVAGGLVVGTIPLLLGLIIILPVLGPPNEGDRMVPNASAQVASRDLAHVPEIGRVMRLVPTDIWAGISSPAGQ